MTMCVCQCACYYVTDSGKSCGILKHDVIGYKGGRYNVHRYWKKSMYQFMMSYPGPRFFTMTFCKTSTMPVFMCIWVSLKNMVKCVGMLCTLKRFNLMLLKSKYWRLVCIITLTRYQCFLYISMRKNHRWNCGLGVHCGIGYIAMDMLADLCYNNESV